MQIGRKSSRLDQSSDCDYDHEQDMSTRKKKHCTRFLLFALVLVFTGSIVRASDWTVIRQRDRPYVTFANVAQFYQFPEYTRVSRTVSLRS